MKREERILLLMPEYVWAGAETQFRYLIEYAENHQWKMDVIIEHRFKKEDELLRKSKAEMVNVKFYELDGNADERIVFQKIICHIVRNILCKKYTVCLIQHMADLAVAPYLRMLGIKVIYSERIDAAGLVRNKYLQGCLKFCNGLLANSEYGKKELERLTGRKVKLIKNGKPVVPMFPIKSNRKIRRILVPARIAPDKNQILVLNYLKKYPEFDGKVIFAGVTGNRPYKGKLQQFVRKNHLEERVEFLGYVEELQEEYRKADLVMLPSFAEGTPNVILEAFGYGRPVIVSDIGPLRSIVTDPGLRFGIKNLEGIHACIKYMEEMPIEMYMQLLQKNRKYVLKNYSIDMMAESYGDIFYNRKTEKRGSF